MRGGGYRSRHEHVLGRRDDGLTEEDVAEDEPLEVHCRRQADQLRRRLATAPPTDPELAARLHRDLQHWERLAAAATVEAHWASGEGDRKLF